MDSWILTLVIFAPLVGAVFLAFAPREAHDLVRRGALAISSFVLVLTVIAVVLYYQAGGAASGTGFRLVRSVAWLGDTSVLGGGRIDVKYAVGIDGISVWLLLLTAFLMPLSIWGSFSAIKNRVRDYYVFMLLLQTGMMGVFCALDLLLFYVFFEFTLIPLFFLIGIWGGPDRRRAAHKFFIYTVAGSVLTFAGVLFIAYFAYAHGEGREFTLDIRKLTALGQSGAIPAHVQWWLFGAFAAGFAIKVPLFPLHTWLPLAHTEAPTAGSVILAGVLLKLGTYGFCRLSLPLLPLGVWAWAPFMSVLAIIGIIYAALAA
ncbi:MAG: NADH-quinone oxidoreductase subunit M, partial [bacterium]|nr:NADH-quinone oxidoreductase subunit M [bacterium]